MKNSTNNTENNKMTTDKNLMKKNSMNESSISETSADKITQYINKQRQFFYQDKTKSIDFRIAQLTALKSTMQAMENELLEALRLDLGKSTQEAYMTEIGVIYHSISLFIKNIGKWAKPKKVKTPYYQFGTSKIHYEPYGVVLIIAPFNYPINLALEPLIGAIAAGNTVILKPSELAPHTSMVLAKLIAQTFDSKYIHCVQGGVDTTTALLANRFDYLFFTGSPKVGKIVMQAAATHLTPVTLELGGKSPVIVDKTAHIDTAAKRIAWGKLLNSGQTCIAPDYLFVHHTIKDELIAAIKAKIREFYGDDPKHNADYGKIINQVHTERLAKLIEADRAFVVYGGDYDVNACFVTPTLLAFDFDNFQQSASMQTEIFGSLLPIISYDNLDDVINYLNSNEKPLALYIFSHDDDTKNKLLSYTSSGNVSINDTIKHISNPHLPFGGVGHSGMGNYHGKHSFLSFSHQKGVYKNPLPFDLSLIFPPFHAKKLKWLKKIFH